MASSFDSYMKSSFIIEANVIRNHVLHDCANASFSANGVWCLWHPTLMFPSVTPLLHSTVVSGVTIPSDSSVNACAVLNVEPGACGLPMACLTSYPLGVFVARHRISPLAGLIATMLPVLPCSSLSPSFCNIGRMVSLPSVGSSCAQAVQYPIITAKAVSSIFDFIKCFHYLQLQR